MLSKVAFASASSSGSFLLLPLRRSITSALPSPIPSVAAAFKHSPTTKMDAPQETDSICRSAGVVLPALPSSVPRAVSALREGRVIAVPTDTLYGLAADACSAQAVEKIYAIKGRSNKVPLAVCLAHTKDFDKYSVTSYLPEGLLEDLFPGPVTTVLQRGEHSLLDEGLNPGFCSIGIRIPDSSFIRNVAEMFGGAIALTSANISGQQSTIRVHEFTSLWSHCAFVFDAGELPATRAGSTVVDLTVPGTFKVLREGSALESTLAILIKHGLSARE